MLQERKAKEAATFKQASLFRAAHLQKKRDLAATQYSILAATVATAAAAVEALEEKSRSATRAALRTDNDDRLQEQAVQEEDEYHGLCAADAAAVNSSQESTRAVQTAPIITGNGVSNLPQPGSCAGTGTGKGNDNHASRASLGRDHAHAAHHIGGSYDHWPNLGGTLAAQRAPDPNARSDDQGTWLTQGSKSSQDHHTASPSRARQPSHPQCREQPQPTSGAATHPSSYLPSVPATDRGGHVPSSVPRGNP